MPPAHRRKGTPEQRAALVDETLRLALVVGDTAADVEALIADTIEYVQSEGGDLALLEEISLASNNIAEDTDRANDYHVQVTARRLGMPVRRPRRPRVANPFGSLRRRPSRNPKRRSRRRAGNPPRRTAPNRYMKYRQTLINPVRDMSEDRLLINDKQCIGTPMDEDVVSHLVTNLGDRVGIKVSCHVFRRLYCITLFEAGIEDDTIRRMMRHSYFSTTSEHYLSADPRWLTKARKTVGGLFA